MITPKTILGFLLFRRDAILSIASSSSARWLGLVFVLSAAMAREYDGEYLLGEPWHLVLPLAASVVGCIALLILLRLLSWCRMVRDVRFLTMFGALLNVYWMTAPLAWLYAIPFERFMDPGGATRANLTLLGIVSVWRVTLMIRSVSVLYGASLVAASMPVMVFCLAMGYMALWLIPSPVFLIMGGIRLTESEDMILAMRMLLMGVGVLTAPIWLIGYLICCSGKSPWKWQLREVDQQNRPASKLAWTLALMSLAIWVPVLPRTQREQWLRWRAEKLLFAGSIDGLSKLSHEHSEQEFAPHWDPPPRLGYGETQPELISTTLAIRASSPANWFWKLYLDKLERKVLELGHFHTIQTLGEKELSGFIELFQDLKVSSRQAQSMNAVIENRLLDESIVLFICPRRKFHALQTVVRTANISLTDPADVSQSASFGPFLRAKRKYSQKNPILIFHAGPVW